MFRQMPRCLRHLLAATSVCFLTVLLIPTLTRAATYYVAPTGSGSTCSLSQPCGSLATGLSKLSSGDTLYLRQGTYADGIDSTRTPIPSGNSWATATTIASYPGETATLRPTTGTNVVNLGGGTAVQYIILDRLDLDAGALGGGGDPATNSQSGYGLTLGCCGMAHHLRFSNGHIRNAYAQNVALYGRANEVLGSLIEGSRTAYGIYISGGTAHAAAEEHRIEGNTIQDNYGYGLHIYSGYYQGPGQGSTDRHLIRNNRFLRNGFGSQYGAAIIAKGQGVRFCGNTLEDNYYGLEIAYGGTDVLVQGNTITRSRGCGIQVAPGATGVVVQGNQLSANGGGDLCVQQAGTVVSASLAADVGTCGPAAPVSPDPGVGKLPAPRNLRAGSR